MKTDYLSALGPLIQRLNQPLPSDSENWLECRECRIRFPRHEIKKETDITIPSETTESAYEKSPHIVGLGNKGRRTYHKRERQRQLDRIDAEPDEDIKRELRKGNIVQIIEDVVNY